ncbi:MAG: divalent-cation tolerance protein CutA [Myxococcota bacterium]
MVAEGGAILVLVTAPVDKADGLARALVERRLAACVNLVGPIRSVYRWDGRVTEDPEILMVVKSTQRQYDALEAEVRALHPYQVPEVLAIDVARGSHPYLAWLSGAVGPEVAP